MQQKFERIYRKSLIEHPYIQNYFQHPNFKEIYCNKDGNIFFNNLQKFWVLKNNGKYNHCNHLGNKLLRHRLIAETFLEIPPELTIEGSRAIVNHLNGRPGDDWLENLEWTNYSGNSVHAFKNGLRFDNRSVLIKDLRTGSVQEFHSLSECARFFNVNQARLHSCLKEHRVGVVHFRFYFIIYKGMEWPTGGPELIGKVADAERKETIVYSKVNRNFTIYETQMQAIEATGISERRIREGLRKAYSAGKAQVEIGDYIIMRYADYFNDNFDIPNADKSKVTKVDYIHYKRKSGNGRSFRKPNPIEVIDLLTNEKTNYESAEIFARKLGVKKNTLQKHILVNKGVWMNKLKIIYLPRT